MSSSKETPLLTGQTTFLSVTVAGNAVLATTTSIVLGPIVAAGGTIAITSGTTLTLDAFDPATVASGTIDLRAGGRLDVLSGSVTIGSGVTLIKNGVLGSTDSIGAMTIQSGGVVTHSMRYEPGLVLNVTGTLDVQSGGTIDVDKKGLRGGANGSAFGNNGEAYDAAGAIVSGAQTGAGPPGGSHGGLGGEPSALLSNAPYGRIEDALFLGPGGAYYTGVAGHGGGRVTVAAGTLIVGGTIRPDGGAGIGNSGGGSGGSIRIVAAAVSGAGTIRARGGAPPAGSNGGGGGGRIAVYFDSSTFATTGYDVRGGSQASATNGSAGTVYLKDSEFPTGDLLHC